MRHIKLGDLEVSRIGLGAMGMSAAYTGAGTDDAGSIRAIHRARDLGVTFLDTAETYWPFSNEELIGRRLAAAAGHRPHRPVLPAPGRPQHADRGHHRRAGRTGGRGQGLPHRPVRGRARHDPPPHAVHPLTALQSECSPWTQDPEADVLPLLRELGIGLVPFSPLGHGFLTGTIHSTGQFDGRDWRTANPRFTGENFQHNLRIANEIEAVAAESGATPAQVALAWLLAKSDDIASIPGTRRVSRLKENIAADGIELTAGQISTFDNLTPAVGDTPEEADMRLLGR